MLGVEFDIEIGCYEFDSSTSTVWKFGSFGCSIRLCGTQEFIQFRHAILAKLCDYGRRHLFRL